MYKEHDRPVQHGLSMTPARIQQLTAKGIAVSQSTNNIDFEASAERGDFTVDPLFERGMDENTLWERSQVAKKKILSSRDRISRKVRQSKSSK